jgi:hypothetical protein
MIPLTVFTIRPAIAAYIRLSPDPHTQKHLDTHVPDGSRTFGNLNHWLCDRLVNDVRWIDCLDGSSHKIDLTPTAGDRKLPAMGSIVWLLTPKSLTDTIAELIAE